METVSKQVGLNFAIWLLDLSENNHGFYNLGDGEFRHKYLSPYSIEELFEIFLDNK